MDRFIRTEQSRATLAAQMHASLVHDDARDPGTKTCLFTERVEVLKGTAIRRLHGVLGVRLIAEDRPRDAKR